MMNDHAATSEQPLPGVNALPVCYTSLTPLVPQRHDNLHFARSDGFLFAQGVNAVPAVAEEFPDAQNSCPIVFTRGETPRPVLLLGASQGRNEMVEADGTWKAGHHVPSFLRRYPFMLVRENDNSTRMLLCADLAADGFSDTSGTPLFQAGKQTDAMNRVLEYCERYEQAQLRTNALIAELAALNLFQESTVSVRSEAESRKIDGFQTISEDKFKALDDAKLADFTRRGVVGLIAAHWASIKRFQDIAGGAGA